MQDIEVITIHNLKGQIKPVKFLIQEDGIGIPVMVKSAMLLEQSTKSKDNSTLRYKCKVVLHECIKECELEFHIQNSRWRLLK